jgi:hypothetical protein
MAYVFKAQESMKSTFIVATRVLEEQTRRAAPTVRLA